MLTYINGCFWTCLITYIVHRYQRNEKKYQFLKIMFAAFPLIYISSVRFNVGMDYPVYKSAFEIISRGASIEDFEILYHKLNELIAYLGGDFRWLFAVTSILFCVMIYKTIFRDSPMPALSAFLLVATTYYFCFFNGVRSMLAYAITFFSLKYVEERRLVPFLIAVIIAGGFHTTAFLFIVVYFIYNKPFSNRFTLLTTVGMFAFAPLLGKAVNYLMSLTKYAGYLKSNYADVEQGYVKLLIIVAVTTFSAFYYDEKDKKFQLYYSLEVISLWLTALVPYVPLIARVRWMFGLPVIVLIPLTISKEKNSESKLLISYLIVGFYAFYCVCNLILYNTNAVLPYQTIFTLDY